MDLVHEEDGPAIELHEAVARLLNLAPQVLHRAGDGGDLDELAPGVLGNDMRERGLARTRRPVENHAREHVVFDRGAQPRPRPHSLILAHVLVEGRGAHAHG